MLHVNKVQGSHDVLPFDLRLYYNEGENFQPLAGRVDASVFRCRTRRQDPGRERHRLDQGRPLQPASDEIQDLDHERDLDGRPVAEHWALEQALGDDLGPTSSTPAIVRGYLTGKFSYDDYAASGGDPDQLRNSIIPAWLQFEKDLKAKFPDFVRAWMGPDSSWGTRQHGDPDHHRADGLRGDRGLHVQGL